MNALKGKAFEFIGGVNMTNEITRNAIIAALQERNYNAIPQDVVKNSVLLQGITIRNETNIAPTIYIDKLIENFDNLDSIVEHIINIYEANKSIDINIDNLTNREWILEHLYIALQKSSGEELIKRTCELSDIEQFLYVRSNLSSDDGWSVKLNPSIMKSANLDIDEAWEVAEKNTFSSGQTIIKSMAEILFGLSGCSDFVEDNSFPQMYVITNQIKVKGSVQVLDKNAIRKFFPDNIHRFVCIPSSIHECILVPIDDDEDINIDDFNLMVQEVNSSEVDETEQLSNHVYILKI